MGRISIAVKHLLTCGASREAVVAAIEEMEAVGSDGIPVELLSRRASDRERQARHRSRDSNVTNVTSPSPSPPMINNSTPLSPPPKISIKSRHEEPLFEEFWGVFPRKIGKGAARKAYVKALVRATHADILAGAKRYAASKPDPEYTKHPTTWLNADCWLDEGARVIPFSHTPQRTWAEIKAARATQGGEVKGT
jgi:hypothetical protein